MDPVLSSLGLAVSVVGFLCQNVPQIAGQYSRSKVEASKLLFDLAESSLDRSRQSYEVWQNKWWDGEPRYNDQYPDLWGKDGWRFVKRSRDSIKTLVDRVLRELGRTAAEELTVDSIEQEDEAAESRACMLRHVAAGIATMPHSNDDARRFLGTLRMAPSRMQTFLRRVWWAVYKHESIANLVDQLEKETEGLKKYCEQAFTNVGLHKDAETVDQAIIQRTKTLIQISRLASTLYDMCTTNGWGSEWILHMERPSQQPNANIIHFWQFVGNARLRFCVRYRLGGSSELVKILDFVPVRRLDQQYDRLTEMGVQYLLSDPRTIEHEGKVYRVRITSVEPNSYKNLRSVRSGRHPLEDAAEASVIATVWFMLVLRAGWFSHLCACRIHWVTFQRGINSGTTINTLAFHPLEAHRSARHCNKEVSDNDKLEMFGLILGELLTMRPMWMERTATGQKIYCVAHLGSFSKNQLIEFVEDTVDDDDAQTNVADAFAWCLTQDGANKGSSRSPYANTLAMVDAVLPR